jgi:hypothetical protein
LIRKYGFFVWWRRLVFLWAFCCFRWKLSGNFPRWDTCLQMIVFPTRMVKISAIAPGSVHLKGFMIQNLVQRWVL